MGYTLLQLVIILILPYLARLLTKRLAISHWLSPVVVCYAVGILFANVNIFPLNEELSTTVSEASVLLAVPLLLFSTNIPVWLKQAKSTILSFLLCVVSVVIVVSLMTLLFAERLPQIWQYAGMMTGLFTGGAPNMQAVGLMLEAESEAIVLVNAADIFCGGAYLIFLTSVAHTFFGLFLKDFAIQQDTATVQAVQSASWKDYLMGLICTLLVVATSLGITYLFTGKLESVVLIFLLLTTLSIALSFVPTIRNLAGTFEFGDYFLLMFCIAIGMLADIGTAIATGGTVLLFMASIWLSVIVLHSLLGYLFGIDRDTLMITSTASIYGPAFVGQVASAINNRQLLFSGMATGLIGYALGNYLGVGLGYLLKSWLGI